MVLGKYKNNAGTSTGRAYARRFEQVSDLAFTATAFLVLVTLIPTILTGLGNETRVGPDLYVAAIFIGYSGTVLSLNCSNQYFLPLRSVLHVFVYSSLGIASFCQQATGLTTFIVDDHLRFTANIICLVAVGAFELSYYAGRHTLQVGGRRTLSLRHIQALDLARLKAASFAALVLSALYIISIGSLAAFASNRQTFGAYAARLGGGQAGEAVSGILTALGSVPVLVALAAWIAMDKPLDRGGSKDRQSMIAALSVANLIVNNPITNSRYWFLAVVCTLVFALLYRRPRVLQKLVVLGAILAITVFPFSDINRYDSKGAVVRQGNNIAEVLSTKDFDQLSMTANGVWYVAIHGHTFGTQLLGSLFFWVPRQIWSGKSLDTGVLIGNALDATNTNLSSPLWIELWIDFGLVGVIIGFAIFGLGSARLDLARVNREAHYGNGVNSALILASYFLAGYSFILLRGPLLQAMGRLGVAVLVLVFIAKFVSVRGQDAYQLHRCERTG